MRWNCGGTFLPLRSGARRAPWSRSSASGRRTSARRAAPAIEHVARGRARAGSARPRRARSCARRRATARSRPRVAAACSSKLKRAAEALAQREAPGAVDARAERRVDHQLRVAGLVEEALEHDALSRRQHAERGLRGAPGTRRAARAALGAEPQLASRASVSRPSRPVARSSVGDLVAQRATPHATARRCGPAPRRARTASSAAGRARPRRSTLPRLDLRDAVRRVAELEDVARHALEGEVLVERADAVLCRLAARRRSRTGPGSRRRW